eukprot:CAMPEP_0168749702 /NCGR_PEP_ID=MMETSP0724-20121128/16858_1 /TAXON_ID=265536 /ORGANISM="Amphiprora sp., Strain CCMP467" /LENGTH=251 /DNA_ID=CAMNT_0008797631 /DNA_START=22 /DNA_END=777 /DNA_ORIENTATION=-
MKMKDLEKNSADENSHQPPEKKRAKIQKGLFVVGLVLILLVRRLVNSYRASIDVPLAINSKGEQNLAASSSGIVKWPHPPKPKKLNHGKVVFLTQDTGDGSLLYKRVFTAPCEHGLLVFNIGPAPDFAPYAYDVYEDAYGYADNGGLCPIYPSWTATQKATFPMWERDDPTEQRIELGEIEQKISTRVVTHDGSKQFVKQGGDFVIIRKGNFYNPSYYRQLQEHVRSFPPKLNTEELKHMLEEFEFYDTEM